MKIKINDRDFELPEVSDVEERKKIIDEFMDTLLLLADNKKMTVEEYYHYTWDKPSTMTSLDRIGYYLSKMPNQEGKKDKEVLTKNKQLEMEKGITRTTKMAKDLTDDDLEFLEINKDIVMKNPKKRYNVYVKTNAVHYDDMTINEKYNTGLAEVEDSE